MSSTTTNCNPFPDEKYSSTSGCGPVDGVVPVADQIDSAGEFCIDDSADNTSSTSRPRGDSTGTVVISRTSDMSVNEILCRLFGINCPPRSTTSRRPSTTQAPSTTSINPCSTIQTAPLSWRLVKAECELANYTVSVDAKPFGETILKGGVFSASVEGDRVATWQYSSDGGKNFTLINNGYRAISGTTSNGWAKGLYAFLLKATTPDGDDMFRVLLNGSTGDKVVELLGSSRNPTDSVCTGDYWELTLPLGVTASDLTLSATGDVQLEQVDNRTIRARGFYGYVSGSVRLRAPGCDVVREVPRLFANNGNMSLVDDNTNCKAESFIWPTGTNRSGLFVFSIAKGYLIAGPKLSVVGGRITERLSDTHYLIEQTGPKLCVTANYVSTCGIAGITTCADTVISSSTSEQPDCGNLIGNFAVQPDNGNGCEPVTGTVILPDYCEPVRGIFTPSVQPDTTSSTSVVTSTTSAPNPCTFRIQSITMTGDSLLVNLADIGTQTGFLWQITDAAGQPVTPLLPLELNGDNQTTLNYGVFTELTKGISYVLTVQAFVDENNGNLCMVSAPFVFDPISSSTSQTPGCTFTISELRSGGNGYVEIFLADVGTQTNWMYQVRSQQGVVLGSYVAASLTPSNSLLAYLPNAGVVQSGRYIIEVRANTNAQSEFFCYDTDVIDFTYETATTSAQPTTSSQPLCTFSINSAQQDGDFINLGLLSVGTQSGFEWEVYTVAGELLTGRMNGVQNSNVFRVNFAQTNLAGGDYIIAVIADVTEGSSEECSDTIIINYFDDSPQTSSSTSQMCAINLIGAEEVGGGFVRLTMTDYAGMQLANWRLLSATTGGALTNETSINQLDSNGQTVISISQTGVPYGNYTIQVAAYYVNTGQVCRVNIPFVYSAPTTSSSSSSSTSTAPTTSANPTTSQTGPVCTFAIGQITDKGNKIYEVELLNRGTQVNFLWEIFSTSGQRLYGPVANAPLNGNLLTVNVGQASYNGQALPQGDYILSIVATIAQGVNNFCSQTKTFTYNPGTTPTTSSSSSSSSTSTTPTTSTPPTTSVTPTTSSSTSAPATTSSSTSFTPGDGQVDSGAAAINFFVSSGGINPTNDYDITLKMVTGGLAESNQTIRCGTSQRFMGGNTIETALALMSPTHSAPTTSDPGRMYYSCAMSLVNLRAKYPNQQVVVFELSAATASGPGPFTASRVNYSHIESAGMVSTGSIGSNGLDYKYSVTNTADQKGGNYDISNNGALGTTPVAYVRVTINLFTSAVTFKALLGRPSGFPTEFTV